MRRTTHSRLGRSAEWPAYVVCAEFFVGVLAALVMVATGGCASSPDYFFNVDTAASLDNYRTFGFFDEREPGMAAYQSVAHRHLKSAIVREMQARGYRRSDEPDLLVNIHLQRSEEARSGQAAPDYYSYRAGHYDWRAGVSTISSSYTDGTLNIDVVDRASRALLWEGIAVGSVSQRMYESLEATIDTVVAKLFQRFPQQSPQQSAQQSDQQSDQRSPASVRA